MAFKKLMYDHSDASSKYGPMTFSNNFFCSSAVFEGFEGCDDGGLLDVEDAMIRCVSYRMRVWEVSCDYGAYFFFLQMLQYRGRNFF